VPAFRYTQRPDMMDARSKRLENSCLKPCCTTGCGSGGRMVRLMRDQHHRQAHDPILDRIYAQVQDSSPCAGKRQLNLPAVSYPPDLPITARKDDIVGAIRAHQVVIIAGETGSGKTTQIPKMCLEAGLGVCGHDRLHATPPCGGAGHLTPQLPRN